MVDVVEPPESATAPLATIVERAARFAEQGAHQAAVDLLRRSRPKSWDQRVGLTAVRILVEAGDLEEALAWLACSHIGHTRIAGSYRQISQAYANEQNLDKAIEVQRLAIACVPQQTGLLVTLLSYLQRANRRDDVIDVLAALVRAEPTRTMHRRRLAQALFDAGAVEEAIAAVREAVAVDPDDVTLTEYLASLLFRTGDDETALAELADAARRTPKSARLPRLLSRQYMERGDIANAVAWAVAAVEAEPGQRGHEQNLQQLKQRQQLRVISRSSAPPIALPALPQARSGRARVGAPTVTTGVAVQARAIGAIILRDMRTRYARYRLGYIWALVEPLAHVTVLSIMATLLRQSSPLGGTPAMFFMTGILPTFMTLHTITAVMSALRVNRQLLQMPTVKPMDLLLARAILMLATQLTIATIIIVSAAIIGVSDWPRDYLPMAGALALLWIFGFSVGVLNAVAIILMPAVRYAWVALSRALYITSGIFFVPEMMPLWIRDVLWWNPIFQLIPWFRTGFYKTYVYHDLSLPYVLSAALAAVLVAFCVERAARQRVLAHL